MYMSLCISVPEIMKGLLTLYSPILKKGGYIGFWVVRHSVSRTVRHDFVSAQYLENKSIDLD